MLRVSGVRRVGFMPIVALLLGMWTSQAEALVCARADLDSRNAETCAKAYAKATRRCLQRGIPLAVCDVSKSDQSCNAVAAGCQARAAIDEVVATVFGGEPRGDDALLCAPGELESGEAAKCARLHVRALQKCRKAGTPLVDCTTATSAERCDALTASCDPRSEAAALHDVVFDGEWKRNKCRDTLAKAATALIAKKLKHRRTGTVDKDVDAVVKATAQVVRKCFGVPQLFAPCDGATTPAEAAACVFQLSERPTFPGIALLSSTTPGAIDVSWFPAVDDATPASALTYDVHVATLANFEPTAATLRDSVTGRTEAVITGLETDRGYFVRVIARDTEGHTSVDQGASAIVTAALPAIPVAGAVVATEDSLGLEVPIRIDSDALVFANGPGATVPTVGTIVVGLRDPDYYLRRIEAVETTATEIRLSTTEASLSDFIDQLSLRTSWELRDVDAVADLLDAAGSASSARQRVPAATGSRVEFGAGRATSTARDQGRMRTAPRASVSGSLPLGENGKLDYGILFEPKVNFSADFGPSGPIKAEFSVGGTADLGGVLTYKLGSAFQAEATRRLLSRTYVRVIPIPVFPFGIPVAIVVDVDGVVRLVGAKTSVTARVSLRSAVRAGATYPDIDGGWRVFSDVDPTPKFAPELKLAGAAEASMRLVPKVTAVVALLSSASLSVDPGASVASTVEAVTDLGSRCFPFQLRSLNAGFDASCFIEADFFRLKSDWLALEPRRVCGPFAFRLFSLPTLSVSAPGTVLLHEAARITPFVIDGANNPFQPSSAGWFARPQKAVGQLRIDSDKLGATFQCDGDPSTNDITFLGYGVLGRLARQCVDHTLTCGRACAEDSDCDDEAFCNGAEVCATSPAGRQCQAGTTPCGVAETCNEDVDRCEAESDSCGNGMLEEDEACDDGNTIPDDGCDENCQLECGNGILDVNEDCDGTILAPGDSCVARGFGSGDLACTATCAIDTNGCGRCGDGVLGEDEQCDDGNTAPDDGCSAVCEREEGYYCQGEPSMCEAASSQAWVSVGCAPSGTFASTPNDVPRVAAAADCDNALASPPLAWSSVASAEVEIDTGARIDVVAGSPIPFGSLWNEGAASFHLPFDLRDSGGASVPIDARDFLVTVRIVGSMSTSCGTGENVVSQSWSRIGLRISGFDVSSESLASTVQCVSGGISLSRDPPPMSNMPGSPNIALQCHGGTCSFDSTYQQFLGGLADAVSVALVGHSLTDTDWPQQPQRTGSPGVVSAEAHIVGFAVRHDYDGPWPLTVVLGDVLEYPVAREDP